MHASNTPCSIQPIQESLKLSVNPWNVEVITLYVYPLRLFAVRRSDDGNLWLRQVVQHFPRRSSCAVYTLFIMYYQIFKIRSWKTIVGSWWMGSKRGLPTVSVVIGRHGPVSGGNAVARATVLLLLMSDRCCAWFTTVRRPFLCRKIKSKWRCNLYILGHL